MVEIRSISSVLQGIGSWRVLSFFACVTSLLWYSLFPMDFKSVLHCIKGVVKELYMLGLHLGIPKGILDALEVENRTDVGKMRREMVKGWMSSSLDPPCWWHLVKALRKAECGTLADKIAQEFGKFMVMLL